MKVLITGGAGFLGSNLCGFFLNKGHEVICVDNLGSGNLNNIGEFMEKENFEFIQTDVTREEDISNIRKVDIILHFASRASPNDYQTHSFETMTANSIGTFNLLKKAHQDKAVFLFASTSEIYGQAEVIPTPESYYGFVNSFGPRSCYDESKRFGESMCYEFLHKFKVDVRIVRIFNTYGPRMKYNDGRVVTNFIHQALNNSPITIYGDGLQTRSFCYVDDLIRGIYIYATKPGLKGQVINLGNPTENTMLELASKVLKITNSKSELVYKELPKDDPVRRVPDISKAKELLEWEPRVSLDEGLTKLVEWFKK